MSMQLENQILKHHCRQRNVLKIHKSHSHREKVWSEKAHRSWKIQKSHNSRMRNRYQKQHSKTKHTHKQREKEKKNMYFSTAESTSFLSIFPPRPDARSNAPFFDISRFPKTPRSISKQQQKQKHQNH